MDQPKEQDDLGVYIQEEWKTLPPTGTVEEVGPQVTVCKTGEKVFFERYSAVNTPWDGVLACRDDAILVVFDGETV